MARNFSEDLDSLFGLHSGKTIGNLSETVQEKSVPPDTHAIAQILSLSLAIILFTPLPLEPPQHCIDHC